MLIVPGGRQRHHELPAGRAGGLLAAIKVCDKQVLRLLEIVRCIGLTKFDVNSRCKNLHRNNSGLTTTIE